MATRRKNWFKQTDSIFRDHSTREQKLAIVMLAAYLNSRWARDGIPDEEAGKCELSKSVFAEVSGKSQLKVAGSLLESLSEFISISVEVRTKTILIDWSNFAEFQGYGARSRGSNRDSSSEQAAPKEKRREDKSNIEGTQTPSPSREELPEGLSLPAGFLQELASPQGNPLGAKLTVEQVVDWIHLKWPALQAKTKPRGRTLAIRNWWQRMTQSELDQAEAKAKRIRIDKKRAIHDATPTEEIEMDDQEDIFNKVIEL